MGNSHVTILLASYNGAEFIAEQLYSIITQSHQNWRLIVSDDGSTDDTRALVRKFIAKHAGYDIRLVDGPRRGSNENFSSLLAQIARESAYIAFADQDDVWMDDKLTRALALIGRSAGPVLYGSSSILVDQHLVPIGHSATPRYEPSFENALVQNIFAGNTCVLNRAAFEIVKISRTQGHMFDWYIYQLLSGAGARIIFDQRATLFYRQHGRNQIGANQGPAARFRRIGEMLRGTYKSWNTRNITALRQDRTLLTLRARKILFGFMLLHRVSGIAALCQLRRLKLYRQGPLGQIGLVAAGVLGRI